MATAKQVAANRKNAKKSTGPRTPEGKSITRLNAKRDGVTGQVITLSPEDAPVFEQLKAQLITEFNPRTFMELTLASAIAWDTWRLDQARAIEMNLYALGTRRPELSPDPALHAALANAITFNEQSQRIALMSIYEQRLSRNIHRNLKLLRELQDDRRYQYEKDREDEVAIAKANDLNGVPYKAPTQPSRNGYVFSTSEILAAANRETIVRTARNTVESQPHVIQFPGASNKTDPHRPHGRIMRATAA